MSTQTCALEQNRFPALGSLRWLALVLSAGVLAWFAVYGPTGFAGKEMFVPWAHDDFGPLRGFVRLEFGAPRPVSTNFAIFFGQFGETFYYLLIYLLVFVALAVTVGFAATLFSLELGAVPLFLFALATTAAFFSTPFATSAFQYLGLVTNLLSYVFGMAAGILLLRRPAPVRLATLGPVFALVMLSAFAKEDLAAFLGVVCLVRLWRAWSQGAEWRTLVGNAGRYAVVACLPYALSVLHSFMNGSPFVLSGLGSYDVSDPLGNLGRNLPLYLNASTGIRTAFGLFAGAIVLLWAFSVPVASLRRHRAASVAAVAAVAALMLPYLLLPRFFDYYILTFFPLLAASLLALCLILGRALSAGRRAVAVTGAGLLWAGVVLTLFILDATLRGQILNWYALTRERVGSQFQEIARTTGEGLRECRSVLVTGVSNTLGPFMTRDPRYLNRRFQLAPTWTIVTEPKSMMDQYGITAEPPRPRRPNASVPPIRFIGQETLDANPWTETHDCWLEFAPDTLRATFHRR